MQSIMEEMQANMHALEARLTSSVHEASARASADFDAALANRERELKRQYESRLELRESELKQATEAAERERRSRSRASAIQTDPLPGARGVERECAVSRCPVLQILFFTSPLCVGCPLFHCCYPVPTQGAHALGQSRNRSLSSALLRTSSTCTAARCVCVCVCE
jgi:hypothetical protein